MVVHQSCLDNVILPCPSPVNFSPDRIRAAFLRTMTTLLVGYRKFLDPVSPTTGRPPSEGKLYNFKLSGWLKSAPRDSLPYLEMLSETQAFSEFIMERCDRPPDDPEIAYFDQMITAKRNRGRHGLFLGKQGTKPPPLPSSGCSRLGRNTDAFPHSGCAGNSQGTYPQRLTTCAELGAPRPTPRKTRTPHPAPSPSGSTTQQVFDGARVCETETR